MDWLKNIFTGCHLRCGDVLIVHQSEYLSNKSSGVFIHMEVHMNDVYTHGCLSIDSYF